MSGALGKAEKKQACTLFINILQSRRGEKIYIFGNDSRWQYGPTGQSARSCDAGICAIRIHRVPESASKSNTRNKTGPQRLKRPVAELLVLNREGDAFGSSGFSWLPLAGHAA